jgi:hypothetical protein
MRRGRRAFAGDENDRANMGGKNAGEMPEVGNRAGLQQTRSLPTGIGARQHRIGQHQPQPTAGPHNVKRKVQEQQIAIHLPTPIRGTIAAQISILRRQIRRIGKKHIDPLVAIPCQSQPIRLVNMQPRRNILLHLYRIAITGIQQ